MPKWVSLSIKFSWHYFGAVGCRFKKGGTERIKKKYENYPPISFWSLYFMQILTGSSKLEDLARPFSSWT